jgi:hypothetical protein
MAAIGSNTIIRVGISELVVKTNNSRRTDINPASCDQKSDLKEPICLA